MINTIKEALLDIKSGKVVIVVDDENRENEGDFVIPASLITTEIVNFMAMHGRGLICAPISQEFALKLNLPPMVECLEDLHQTAFTVSVDAAQGTSTGISANDRFITLQKLSAPLSEACDFVRPGHIFPLIAKDGGVIERAGHTEAAVDLAKLCQLPPVGVICEILNPDGSCARLPELIEIAKKFNLKLITIEDLIKYQEEQNLKKTHFVTKNKDIYENTRG